MSIELIIALTSGVLAIFATGISVLGTGRMAQVLARQERRYKAEQEENKYREPLVRAAYDLQSRLYNILKQNFVGTFMIAGTQRDKDYAIANTVFVIGQYFAWTEITRTEIRFINLGADKQTRRLSHLLDEIYRLWGSDNKEYGRQFRIFAGEQRAIGEAFVDKSERGLTCIGYGEFLATVMPRGNSLVHALTADIRALPDNLVEAQPRLVAIQHALIDLLKLLDPKGLRFPKKNLTKVSLKSAD